jgi:hypothetical protein
MATASSSIRVDTADFGCSWRRYRLSFLVDRSDTLRVRRLIAALAHGSIGSLTLLQSSRDDRVEMTVFTRPGCSRATVQLLKGVTAEDRGRLLHTCPGPEQVGPASLRRSSI